MTAGIINHVRRTVTQRHPLIHCITNPIAINQSANALLAIGARPIMAEHPREVSEITASAAALLLNLGNITDVRMESMRLSAKSAAENRIPFVLDLVGVACSTLRRDYAADLLDTYCPSIIKGNYSEIAAMNRAAYRSSGVDADSTLTEKMVVQDAVSLAKKVGSVVLASGKCDIVTDGTRLVRIYNGTAQLASVTGTGCMLGALCAAYLSVQPDITAAVTACAVMGICGELAQTEKGSGSFFAGLMDALSVLTEETLETHLRMEEEYV